MRAGHALHALRPPRPVRWKQGQDEQHLGRVHQQQPQHQHQQNRPRRDLRGRTKVPIRPMYLVSLVALLAVSAALGGAASTVQHRGARAGRDQSVRSDRDRRCAPALGSRGRLLVGAHSCSSGQCAFSCWGVEGPAAAAVAAVLLEALGSRRGLAKPSARVCTCAGGDRGDRVAHTPSRDGAARRHHRTCLQTFASSVAYRRGAWPAAAQVPRGRHFPPPDRQSVRGAPPVGRRKDRGSFLTGKSRQSVARCVACGHSLPLASKSDTVFARSNNRFNTPRLNDLGCTPAAEERRISLVASYHSSIAQAAQYRRTPQLRASTGEGEGPEEVRPHLSDRPPLLVTVGPPCAGKTSTLRQLAAAAAEGAGASVVDVAIDDHPSVYFKIPLGLLLGGRATGGDDDGEDADAIVGGRSVSDRLRDPGSVETRLVALRLLRIISAAEFRDRVRGVKGKASEPARDALCGAVEAAVKEGARVSTKTVDIFVRENLFPLAISSSQRKLAYVAAEHDGIVAWGNTNTQARDFGGALEQAELTGRPVRFVRWGHELPSLTLKQLSLRNVLRFAASGRYVEVAAIELAVSRVATLYSLTSGGDPASLAAAAGFRMDASGRVSKSPSRHAEQFRREKQSPRGRITSRDLRAYPAPGGIGGDQLRQNPGSGGGGDGSAENPNARRGSGNHRHHGRRFEPLGGDVSGDAGIGDGAACPSQGPRAASVAAAAAAAQVNARRHGRPDVLPPASACGRAAVFSAVAGGGSVLEGGGAGGGQPPSSGVSRATPSFAPPIARPLPVGALAAAAVAASGAAAAGAVSAATQGGYVGASPCLGLAQAWQPRGGCHLPAPPAAAVGAGGGGERVCGFRRTSTRTVSRTIMFGSEWQRQREWRRSGYSDEDIDPMMTACYFAKPANSTGTLKQFEPEAGGADFEEMDLIRRIRSIRQQR